MAGHKALQESGGAVVAAMCGPRIYCQLAVGQGSGLHVAATTAPPLPSPGWPHSSLDMALQAWLCSSTKGWWLCAGWPWGSSSNGGHVRAPPICRHGSLDKRQRGMVVVVVAACCPASWRGQGDFTCSSHLHLALPLLLVCRAVPADGEGEALCGHGSTGKQ